MDSKKPHIHAEFIKAWADGEPIEFKNHIGDWEYVAQPVWTPGMEYRVKQKPIWYRVVKYRNYTSTLDSHGTSATEASLEKDREFVCWLSERVCY